MKLSASQKVCPCRDGTLRVLFGYFLLDAKSNYPSPLRELRGFANLESAHKNNDFARTKLNPFVPLRGDILVADATTLPHPGHIRTRCVRRLRRKHLPTPTGRLCGSGTFSAAAFAPPLNLHDDRKNHRLALGNTVYVRRERILDASLDGVPFVNVAVKALFNGLKRNAA